MAQQLLRRVRNIMKQPLPQSRKPRRIHQIQVSHPRRFNAYKIAGYSFGALTTMVVVPIVLWPIADAWVLPSAIQRSLNRPPGKDLEEQYRSIWGRERELSHVESKLQCTPNNVWVLNGPSNAGKTAFLHKLLATHKGIIYVDLRHFFDGNAFVFELIDSLYGTYRHESWFNTMVGTYVKLFTFVTVIISKTDEHVTAMLYFHADLNHLKLGLQDYARRQQRTANAKGSERSAYPLLIFDHFEALPLALKSCTDPKQRQMLLSVIYSILQYSKSVCHDLSLSHVMFVGNDLLTTNMDTTNQKDGMQISMMNEAMLKYCEFWNMSGIDEEVAIEHISSELQSVKPYSDKAQLSQLATDLVHAIGTQPYDLSMALNAMTHNAEHMDEQALLTSMAAHSQRHDEPKSYRLTAKSDLGAFPAVLP